MTLKQVFHMIAQDCQRYENASDVPNRLKGMRYAVLLMRPAVMTLAIYRFSHLCHMRDWKTMAGLLYRLNLVLTGADISPASRIGPGCLIVHTVGTVIQATLGKNVTLYAHVVIQPTHPADPIERWPQLGDEVNLGSNTTVYGPVYVANRVTLAPFGLVDKSINEGDCVISASPGKDRLVIRRELKDVQD